MIDFIARYFSSFWELVTLPFRVVWHGIMRLFPSRDCTVMDITTGNVDTYRQNTFWRFAKFCVMITMCAWAAWSTYVYMYHRPLLQKRTQQLEQMRDKHERHMNDLKIYLKKYNDLARDLNILDDKISKASKDSDREELLNAKSKILGELDFLHVRVSEMMDNEKYVPEFDKISELSLEFDLVRNENATIKQQNQQIIEASNEIADADKKIIDVVVKLTTDNITELQSKMKQINTNIIKLGLNEKKL